MSCVPGIVLLAAGRSLRMGRPKLLLPWGDTSVLGHFLREWPALGAAQIAVVLASGNTAIESELDRLGFPAGNRIRNQAPERGMFSSVQCAARWDGWASSLSHWAIALGDQPHLRRSTLAALLRFAAEHPDRVCQPARGGHARHPVLLPRTAFAALAETPALTLKEFLRSRDVLLCELDDPGLDLDLDHPEDYERALRLVRPG